MIVACLCWFDERPAMLRDLVRSLHGVADGLIAFDGPFARHPHEGEESPAEQRDALEQEAARVGLPLSSPPGMVWETQAAKRTALLRFASCCALIGEHKARPPREPRPVWLLVVDGDERVGFSQSNFRHRLELVAPAKACALVRGPRASRMPRLIRARADLRYDGAHNRLVCDDGVVFDGSPVLPHEDLFGWLTIEHDRQRRYRDRLMDANRYRRARREAGER